MQGTCTGTATVSIDLQLKGQRRRGSSPATLDASGDGAVLRIDEGARVAISSLRIIDGTRGEGAELTLEDNDGRHLAEMHVVQ